MKISFTEGNLNEDTLRYMAQMAKEQKWDGEVVFGGEENYNRRSDNKIYISLNTNNETAIEKGCEPELVHLSIFAHELYHATDTAEHISYQSSLDLLETLYQKDTFDKGELYEKRNKVTQDMIKMEKATDSAIRFLPKEHPQYEKMREVFQASNDESNQEYQYVAAEMPSHYDEYVSWLKEEKVNLYTEEDYVQFKQWNDLYREGVIQKRMKAFDEASFDHQFEKSLQENMVRGNIQANPAEIKSALEFEKTTVQEIIEEHRDIQFEKTTVQEMIEEHREPRAATSVIDQANDNFLRNRESEREELIRRRVNPTEQEKEVDQRHWENVVGLWFPEDGLESQSEEWIPIIHGGNSEAIQAFLEGEHGYKTQVNMPNTEEKRVSNEGIMVHSQHAARAKGYATMSGGYSKENEGRPAVLMGHIQRKYMYQNDVADEFSVPIWHADKIKNPLVIDDKNPLYKAAEKVYENRFLNKYKSKEKENEKDKDTSLEL